MASIQNKAEPASPGRQHCSCGVQQPVCAFLGSKGQKARRTNCKAGVELLCAVLSQPLVFSYQAKLYATTQRLGIAKNLCNLRRLAIRNATSWPNVSRAMPT
jgi:hypothetical protein